MDLHEKALFILDSPNNTRLEKLEHVLSGKSSNLIGGVGLSTIELFPIPLEINPKIRFDYSYDELVNLFYSSGYEKISSLTDFLLDSVEFCGIRIDETSLPQVKKISGFPDGTRFYRISGVIGKRRISLRIIPNKWEEIAPELFPHFSFHDSCIWIDNHLVGKMEFLFRGSSIRNFGYLTSNSQGEQVLSINPRQNCYQNCRFCLKGLRLIDETARASLLNFSPTEITHYLQLEFPQQCFESLTEVSVLTGRFASSDQVLKYLSSLSNELIKMTNGKFDPIHHENQRLKISTHLLQNQVDMEIAKSFGIKRFVFPIEIFNQTLRTKYMTSSNYKKGCNKGDISIDEIFHTLEIASQVFGSENIEPVILIGIDSYKDTIQGLMRLYENGYNRITYNIFRIYDFDQYPLYHMTLEEIVQCQVFILSHFCGGYKQVLNSISPNNKSYKKMQP